MKSIVLLPIFSLFLVVVYAQNTEVTDIDGNSYSTVIIGKQEWMVENLKVTKFNDGTPIAMEKGDLAWANLATPAFCWYDNAESPHKDLYGGLYNWYAVETGKLCPVGWHVPTHDEWMALIDFLEGYENAGDKMKKAGNDFWPDQSIQAEHSSGFDGLAGGSRAGKGFDGWFMGAGTYGSWWSSSDYSKEKAWRWQLMAKDRSVRKYSSEKVAGGSIRCVKD